MIAINYGKKKVLSVSVYTYGYLRYPSDYDFGVIFQSQYTIHAVLKKKKKILTLFKFKASLQALESSLQK